MLMMFSGALRKAPFERAIPFNENDLMILINPYLGIRLCNVVKETGENFKIGSFIMQNPEIFGKQGYSERIKEFAEIFHGRVERFFVTKKNDYLFFDLEEQKFLKKLMSKSGLSCSVELYKYSKDKAPEKINYLDLTYKQSVPVTKFLSSYKIRAVMDCRDYYNVNKRKYDENRFDFEKMKSDIKNKKESEMQTFYSKYPKLKGLDDKKRVNLYFKKLTIKYHPDKGGDADICSSIRQDFENIKSTRWYINLIDENVGDVNGDR